MTKWIVSTPLKSTDLMKNFVCFTEVELQKLLEQYPEAIVEMKDSHLEDHAHLPLNENQRIAINNAKKSFGKGADLYDCAIDMMLYDGLTDKEWAKVTVAFLLWALEREEE